MLLITIMRSKEILLSWIEAFKDRDADRVASFYHEDAINWQVADEPVKGRENIRNMMRAFFEAFPDSYSNAENIMADGPWAAWEWEGGGTFTKDLGDIRATGKHYELRGCGFFFIVDGKIKLQRGYWDKASWCRQIGVGLDSSVK
jgi:steroid delta-isomerase-like uncharacterized protein